MGERRRGKKEGDSVKDKRKRGKIKEIEAIIEINNQIYNHYHLVFI